MQICTCTLVTCCSLSLCAKAPVSVYHLVVSVCCSMRCNMDVWQLSTYVQVACCVLLLAVLLGPFGVHVVFPVSHVVVHVRYAVPSSTQCAVQVFSHSHMCIHLDLCRLCALGCTSVHGVFCAWHVCSASTGCHEPSSAWM